MPGCLSPPFYLPILIFYFPRWVAWRGSFRVERGQKIQHDRRPRTFPGCVGFRVLLIGFLLLSPQFCLFLALVHVLGREEEGR